MKRYTYNILVAGKNSECFSTKEVSAFINSAVGVPIVSDNMILNYFSRPHLSTYESKTGRPGALAWVVANPCVAKYARVVLL
eukprot:COSAG05_NODE_114_length_18068_cov_60.696422_7_plen_82_part_00